MNVTSSPRTLVSATSQQTHIQVPRPQVALPHTPPQTPPTHKDFGAINGLTPAHPQQQHQQQPVLPHTPEPSPKVEYSSSFSTLPGSHSGIGLGIGFTEKGYTRNEDLPINSATAYSPQRSVFTPIKLSNPYKGQSPPGMSTLAYLLRVPRRLRPVLLLFTSLFVIAIVLVSRTVTDSSGNSLETFIRQRQGLAAFGRRFVDEQEYTNLSELRQVVIADSARITAHAKIESQPFEYESKTDELLALLGFITAATGNSLPPTIDTTQPLDASLLLGFNPTTVESAAEDLEFLKEEVNTQYPLVLLGRLRDPWQGEMMKLLEHYKISPEPLIIDVDLRKDHEQFIPTLERLLDSSDLPQLLLLGKPLGNVRDILAWEDAEFKSTVMASDAVSVRSLTKKDKHRREKERQERERLLRPAPIVE
ncbi:uncharacterized protein EHS24_008996 [Apiotrichum porosum]|uniref:Uncharacterized protein n=1 Tax=Apiotrichum porosum TaxID=105984 RepID=A0A427XNS4_9TREE|nr:uncharacterized protein EHS24_008996 [Apiotrichum porosum]RSH80418.1 hypothetical protein EHS24_008996 [Apiotrichum porosum]